VASARLESQRERERRTLQDALDACMRSIRLKTLWEEPAVKAEVERYLSEHNQLGTSLPLIEAEVNAILDRHKQKRDEEARHRIEEQSRTARESFHRALLLQHGESRAWTRTLNRDEWDSASAAEACDAVRERLDEVVRPDWTEKQVDREVDDVLDEWD
jgi:hypothetical protein